MKLRVVLSCLLRRIRQQCLVILTGCLLLALPAMADVLVVSGVEQLSLAGKWSLLEDKEGTLELQDVLAPSAAQRFTPLAGSLSLGYTRSTSWLRIRLVNAERYEQTVVLRMAPQMLDHLDVYVQQAGAGEAPDDFRRYRLGDRTPAAETGRVFPVAGVSIVLPPSESVVVFVRVRTTSSHLLGAQLMTPERYQQAAVITLVWVSAYQAVAFAFALITFIQGVRLRDLTHGLYGFLPLGLGINSIGTEGVTAIILPDIAHLINDQLVGFSVMLSFGGLSLFAIRLFETARYHPFGHRYLQLITVLGVAGFLSSGTDFYGTFAQALMALGLFYWVFLTWAAWRMIGRGDKTIGRLFIAAFTLPLLGATISFSRYLGWLPQTELTQYILPVTSLIHMLLMNLALSERLLDAESRFRHATQRAVLEAEHRRDQEQLLTMISHEIRTPIAVIDAATQSLQALDESPDTERSTRYQRIRRSVDRLVLLLDLASARREADKLTHVPQYSRVEVESFTRDILDLLDLDVQSRFDLYASQPGLSILGEPRWLRFAWLNLIDNACKYSDRGTRIKINISPRTHEGSDGVEWRIDDCGPGIVPGSEDRIFEKYQRGGEGKNTPGLGLGLYLARSGIERHGGSLHAVVREGGATFVCWLPVKSFG